MKTIALVDLFWDGHHETYFKAFTGLSLKLGYRVIAFCPKPQALNEWVLSNLPDYIHNIHIFAIQKPVTKRASKLKLPLINRFYEASNILIHWQHTARSIQSAVAQLGVSPDLVFFAWMDSYLSSYIHPSWVDRIFPYQWSGLYFQPRYLRETQQQFAWLRTGPFKQHSVFQATHCQSIALLDEGVADALQAKLVKKPVIIFPDFTDDSQPDSCYEPVKEIQQRAKGRKIIGLLGALAKRKGFLSMLNLAREMLTEDWFFVFAGQLHQNDFLPNELLETETFIKSAPHNCFFHLGRIPAEPQFNALVNVCDVLFAVYDYAHSSNILTKAAVFEKPVITGNRFCMAERVQRYHLGVTVNPENLSEYLKALQFLNRETSSFERSAKFDFTQYRQIHSIHQLRKQFEVLLNVEDR